MRAIVLALLAATPTFVPADPPPRTVVGVEAAGDVVVFSILRRTEALAAGKPVAIEGVAPRLAVAPDGAAAIAALDRRGLFVRARRPGNRFARPRGLGRAELYDVAIAPGGWIAAAWLTRELNTVEAAVLDPRGHVRRSVLDRGDIKDAFSLPQVGIDAHGRATVVWTRWRETGDYEATRQTVRVARYDRRWTSATTLGTGANPIFDVPEWPLVGLAVTPRGHSLLAWATPRGIRASADGARPRTLAKLRTPGSPTVALAASGAAVVAFSQATEDGDDPILAVDRGARGWSKPHRISGTSEGIPSHTSDGDDGAQDVALTSAIAADGRALVTWMTDGAAAAAGQAGGAWAPARRVTIPTRSLFAPPSAALDAGGNPWMTWVEGAVYDLRGRPAGARLVTDAPPPDTAAPALAATIPQTVRVGPVRVPVTCSEPCDVRVQITARPEFEFDLPDAEAVRAVASSATVTVRPFKFVLESWRREPPPSLKIDVLASDRAGNVAQVTGTAKLRR
jgi:hypothetical protein